MTERSRSGWLVPGLLAVVVIGLLAASHIGDGHERVLEQAGAQRVAATYAEAAAITRTWLDDAL